MDNHYDVVLVYISFRRHERYLNIAKYLGRKLKIGILKLDIKTKHLEKTTPRFLAECLEGGAELVTGNASCHSLVFPRLSADQMEALHPRIKESLSYQKLLYLPSGPSHGVQDIPTLHRLFGPFTVLAYDLKHFAEYEPATREALKQIGADVIEVGSPCQKYPIIEDFKTDYLVAYPSHLSCQKIWQAYRLLSNFFYALEELPREAEIWAKPHNVKDEGNWLSSRGFLERFPLPYGTTRVLLKMINGLFGIRVGNFFFSRLVPNRLLYRFIWLNNHYIFLRSKNLLDRYPGFGLEHFVVGIRKGLVTGLTNAIWETLYQRKPVRNCDDMPVTDRLENFRILYSSYRMAEWTGFSTAGFDTISESARKADLLDYLLKTKDLVEAVHAKA